MEKYTDRKDLPTIRITAIWDAARGTRGLPPVEIAQAAAKAASKLFAVLGFTHVCINVGPLGQVIDNQANIAETLLSEEKFSQDCSEVHEDGSEITPEQRKAAINERAEEKIKSSKISIEDMLRGIDINNTKEGK